MSLTAQVPPSDTACEDLIRQLESLRREMLKQAEVGQGLVEVLRPDRRQSAENLLHYLALRSNDLRELQQGLERLGLSSLGEAAPAVLPALESVLHQLYLLAKQPVPEDLPNPLDKSTWREASLLQRHFLRLLGKQQDERRTRIMVTMSSEAADDYLLVHRLVKNGMDCLRINCSHDDRNTWSRTIDHVRDAERATGRACRILMDMGGPKLRIGPMESPEAVLKIKPERNTCGKLVHPARIWLTVESSPRQMEAANASLRIEESWLKQLQTGDSIRLVDARGSKRRWRVREVGPDGCWVEAKKTAYLVNGTELKLKADRKQQKTSIQGLVPGENFILLRVGDVLFVSESNEPGQAAIHDRNGVLLNPGRISLPVAEVYRDARPGERVCFDDGRIVGVIEKIEDKLLQLRITHTRKPLEKLSRDKGVNFPDTNLDLPALGSKDLEDLEFIAHHADLIGLSFANCKEDVSALRKRLGEMGREGLGVILKIETRRGFAHLPEMLFEAMKFPACGVMIARGDMGVECGFERMVELQEEIVCLCEAAHVPVIWATQVLENLAKRGHPTRAEVTDAGLGQAAECVMLNKGPYIIEAVIMLDQILRDMQEHRYKNRPLLKSLHVASQFKPKEEPHP
jgi:pyruvate kinase